MSGTILSADHEHNIRFQTIYGAEILLPVTDIMAIKDDDGAPLTFSGGKSFITMSGQEQPQNQVSDESAQALAEGIENIEPAAGETEEVVQDPSAYKWTGRINFGASLDDGNNNKKAVTGDAEVKARNKKNRWIMGGDANYAEDEGVETENDQSVYGEYNRFLNEKWFVGARTEFEIDKIALLDLRSQAGIFVGRQFYEQDDLNLRTRLGFDYIHEDFSNGDTEEDIAAAWAFDYDQTFFEKALTLFHNHELDVPVSDTSAFLFDSKTGVRVPVGRFLTGTAQVDFDWDNAPAEGVREEDVTYSLKLGYEW